MKLSLQFTIFDRVLTVKRRRRRKGVRGGKSYLNVVEIYIVMGGGKIYELRKNSNQKWVTLPRPDDSGHYIFTNTKQGIRKE